MNLPHPTRLRFPRVAARADLACNPVNADQFFAWSADDQRKVARKLCGHCPAQAQCRAHALAAGEPDGVWGGTTERDRKAAARVAANQAAPPAQVLKSLTRDTCSR